MADLRACLTEAGYADVTTYIASGNVALTAEACEPEALSSLIEERFGLTVPVVVRTGEQLASVIEHNPLPDAVGEPKFLLVYFCSTGFDRDAVATFDHQRFEPDRLAVAAGRRSGSESGRPTELYVAYRDGMSKSKLDNTVLDRHFGVSTTGRNWSTVLKLHEMANRP
jgi:uncharacterized protein (DUF1697 family)